MKNIISQTFLSMNYGRFANVSFRQLSVRQRPGSIRQRSYVTS